MYCYSMVEFIFYKIWKFLNAQFIYLASIYIYIKLIIYALTFYTVKFIAQLCNIEILYIF